MLSQERVLELVKSKQLTSECIDGRDFGRLATYFPASEWEHFGYKLKDGAEHEPTPWTKENILDEMRGDVAFGFRKALDKRGISASLMHSVVRMWLFILEEHELYSWTERNYAQYGLPSFKRVAEHYGLENPIGDDEGTENKYAET